MNVNSPYSPPPLPADSRNRFDAAFQSAIAEGVFPGACLLVARDRKVVFEGTWGRVKTGGVPVSATTRFDLASLTKALVTAPLCMIAADAGALGLDDSISRFFPSLVDKDKDAITVRSLLSHSSGLPPYVPFYLKLAPLPAPQRRDALASMILNTPLDSAPGKAPNYSDLGFMLLGLILERRLGGRLDRLARELLFEPLGIDELHFCPLHSPASVAASLQQDDSSVSTHARGRYAATQYCPWRKKLLWGEVDDENCWALDGVAGHAGLFGTARGVFQLLNFLWGLYESNGAGKSPVSGTCAHPHPPISPETLRLFWTRTDPAGSSDWCLGFDTPSAKGYSSAGGLISQKSIGHLGFTGVSFWLDLKNRILIILLTNRVHPTRKNDDIRQFRPLLHDIVMKELLYGN
ncbi:MAG: serine hydrolase domain-containing protein [Syntrophobacteraceae bacterium]